MILCRTCGAECKKRKGEENSRFQKRKYCSHACSTKAVTKRPETKTCPSCKEPFAPKRWTQQYCSQACYARASKSWHKRKPIDMPIFEEFY